MNATTLPLLGRRGDATVYVHTAAHHTQPSKQGVAMPTTTTTTTTARPVAPRHRVAQAATDKPAAKKPAAKKPAAKKPAAKKPAAKKQPAKKPAAQPKVEVTLQRPVAELVRDYVNTHGSTAIDAPEKAQPFLSGDRVYLQLEGRVSGGLLAYAREQQNDLPKGVLRAAILDAGFTRRPFSYHHPERGQTSASHYSASTASIPGVTLSQREARERTARAEKVQAKRAAVNTESVEMRPDGNDEDKAKLAGLEKTYNDARDALKCAATEAGRVKRTGKAGPEKDAAVQAAVDAKDAAKVAVDEAKAEWMAFRRHMADAAKAAKK